MRFVRYVSSVAGFPARPNPRLAITFHDPSRHFVDLLKAVGCRHEQGAMQHCTLILNLSIDGFVGQEASHAESIS